MKMMKIMMKIMKMMKMMKMDEYEEDESYLWIKVEIAKEVIACEVPPLAMFYFGVVCQTFLLLLLAVK